MLDMGTLVDAIHVGNGSHLELRALRIPNCASRHVHKPSQRVRLRVAGIFALWPSITLAINSSVSPIAPQSGGSDSPPLQAQCFRMLVQAHRLARSCNALMVTQSV